MNKKEWATLGNHRRRALENIAQALGKDHTVTRMLGSKAWGRHEWEQGPSRTLQGYIVEASALDGVFQTINLWARDHDRSAQHTIITIYLDREELA